MNDKRKYKIFDANCGSRRVIEVISPKWRALILCALGDGTQRYNELLRRIEGISQKMLTETLQRMERDGLIARKSDSPAEQKVEYSLTHLGKTLHEHLAPLCNWAEAHLDELVSRK